MKNGVIFKNKMSLHCAWIKCSMKERNSKKSAKF